jgi:P pilus assembly chaperone PapD
MKNNRFVITILVLLILALFSAGPALAGYTIVPMQFTLSGKPGETVTRTMKAENTGEEPVSIKSRLTPEQ